MLSVTPIGKHHCPLIFLPRESSMAMAVGFSLRDKYGLCSGLEIFWNWKFSRKDWNTLTDRLLKRLTDSKSQRPKDFFSRDYQRDRLSNEIIRADSFLSETRANESTLPCSAIISFLTTQWFRQIHYHASPWKRGVNLSEPPFSIGIGGNTNVLPGNGPDRVPAPSCRQ